MGRQKDALATTALVVSVVCLSISTLRLVRRKWQQEAGTLPDLYHPRRVGGTKNTVLFITSGEPGHSNVHLATSLALLQNHGHVDVHFAAFPMAAERAERMHNTAAAAGAAAAAAAAATPSASSPRFHFHSLPGLDFGQAVWASGLDFGIVCQGRGMTGIDGLTAGLQVLLSPWSGPDHCALFLAVRDLIDTVDPAVIITDNLFRPGIDAARESGRRHVILTPNVLADTHMNWQGWGRAFWKYPAFGSGFQYPVPWHLVPANVYLVLRLAHAVVTAPSIAEKKAHLRESGLFTTTTCVNPITPFALTYRLDVPWICQDSPNTISPGATVPLDIIPPNVIRASPIILASTPQQGPDPDPSLTAWLRSGHPTVLINLGSISLYTEAQAVSMSYALVRVLDAVPHLQVLWKFRKAADYADPEVLVPEMAAHVASGRIRLESWLAIDPAAMLLVDNVVASCHHGGANSYFEAIAAGVPQVVLPPWIDCYGYACLAEQCGVGVWACKDQKPAGSWDAGDLGNAILRVVDGGKESVAMRNKAKGLSEEVATRGRGRDIAAEVIADMAALNQRETVLDVVLSHTR
ncbi:hypothetical protein N0V82_010343 [Gnomoniopsis sp. IMI 355080]|nr:hypothetical protein N0V82_010343 [Gnomoniopsis sp. IMI 355080]